MSQKFSAVICALFLLILFWLKKDSGEFFAFRMCGLLSLLLSYFDLPINSFHLAAHFPQDIYFWSSDNTSKRQCIFSQRTFSVSLTKDFRLLGVVKHRLGFNVQRVRSGRQGEEGRKSV